MGKAGHFAAGVQIDADVDVGPDALAHEGGDPVGNAGHGRAEPRPLDKNAIQVETVVPTAFALADVEGGHIEYGHQHQASQHVLGADFAQQVFKGHGTFVLVAVVAAEGDQALPRSRLRSHDHGEWDQVTAPDAGVAQRDPVVAAAGTLQIDVGGTDDIACHFIAPRLVARQASRTAPYLRGTDGPGTEPITSQNRRFCSQAILAVEPDRGKTAPARPRARHWKNENFAAEQIQTAPLGGPSERGRTAIFRFALAENRSPCRRAPINGTCNASA